MLRRVLHNAFWESIELLVAGLCLISGIPMLLAPDVYAPPIMADLPRAVLYWWAASIILGGVLNAFGILAGNTYPRRAGLALLSGSCAVLAFILVGAGDPSRLLGILTYLLAAVAFAARFRALGKIAAALDFVVRMDEAHRDPD